MPPTDQIVVAHVVLNLKVGGLERVVVNLVRGLRQTRYRSIVCILEEAGEFATEVESLGAQIQLFGKKPGIDWRCIWKLAQFLRREHVDIVHTHNMAPHFHGLAAAILAGVPVRTHTKHGRDNPTNQRSVRLNHFLSRFTHMIVPVSDNAAEVVRQIEKVSSRKVQRIWNGVDTGLYKPEVRAASNETPSPATQKSEVRSPVIGTVARLSSEKDQKTMLQAFKLVLDQWGQTADSPLSSDVQPLTSDPLPHPRLVIVGDGPCLAELRNEAKRLDITGQVDFLGARSDIPELLNSFTIFTLSSITEGISMTILEAMACGLPVVATDAGGNREIVQPPQCGLIVPAYDPQALAAAYLELIRDPAQRAQMGVTGRHRVIEYFSLQSMVEQYAKLYAELLSSKQ